MFLLSPLEPFEVISFYGSDSMINIFTTASEALLCTLVCVLFIENSSNDLDSVLDETTEELLFIDMDDRTDSSETSGDGLFSVCVLSNLIGLLGDCETANAIFLSVFLAALTGYLSFIA